MPRDFLTFQTVVRGGLVVAGLGLVAWYIIFQSRFLLTGPTLAVTNNPTTVQTTRTVTLSGTAQHISRLWLNDRLLFTDPDGAFTTDVVLETGYTILTLRAEDRYGRQTTLVRDFVYLDNSSEDRL